MKVAMFGALVIGVMAGVLVAAGNPKETVGFFGTATGKVVSRQADGTGFVLKVTAATPGEKSEVKDGKVMEGKTITLGVRMPKKDGVGAPHVDDVAYVKGLKVGEEVTVEIFAVRSDPSVLRITKPGTSEARAATQAATQK